MRNSLTTLGSYKLFSGLNSSIFFEDILKCVHYDMTAGVCTKYICSGPTHIMCVKKGLDI